MRNRLCVAAGGGGVDCAGGVGWSEMNAKVKRLWLRALRSGKYEQGKGELRTRLEITGFKYCCLGVLEKLRCDAEGVRFPSGKEVLTDTTMRWADLDDKNPDIPNDRSLAELNDDGYDFNYIADRIEKYL